MKKYLNLLLVAIFAAMSFAFVSCSDDNEPNIDPNNPLTLDGINTDVNSSRVWSIEVQNAAVFKAELSQKVLEKASQANLDVVFDELVSKNSIGMKLNPSYIKLEGTVFNKEKEKNEEIKCIFDATDETNNTKVEGKIIVENVTSSEIVLKFDNLVLINGMVIKKINGTLKYKLTEVKDF
ncbi:MAG: hypothetical protein ACI4AK_07405 [Lepagella sp.]